MAEEEKSGAEDESKVDCHQGQEEKVEEAPGANSGGTDPAEENAPHGNRLSYPLQEILLAPRGFVPTKEHKHAYVSHLHLPTLKPKLAFISSSFRYEVLQEHCDLPMLLLKRSENTPQGCLGEEKSDCFAITDLTLAASLDDVPYGYDVARLGSDPEQPANLLQLAGKGEAAVEEKKQEEEERCLYLCVGTRCVCIVRGCVDEISKLTQFCIFCFLAAKIPAMWQFEECAKFVCHSRSCLKNSAQSIMRSSRS